MDWDGAGRGDRRFDLVTLRYDLELRAPDLAGELDAYLRRTVPAGVLRLCWAHVGIRLVDWAIRHHGPADVERWLGVAERATSCDRCVRSGPVVRGTLPADASAARLGRRRATAW